MVDLKVPIQELLNGNGAILDNSDVINTINSYITIILSTVYEKKRLSDNQVEMLEDILHLGNIVYNNMPLDDNKQPIENGTYDILLEIYREYRTPQVGAEPVIFKSYPKIYFESKMEKVTPLVTFLDDFNKGDLLYKEELLDIKPVIDRCDLVDQLVTFSGFESNKKYREVSHNNPSLVGTLDKCKRVLCAGLDEEILNDPSYKILERDFFGKHIMKGIIDPNEIYNMMLEFKYDGLSVVVTVKNSMVISAVSRGDTGMDKATDLTPILYGYTFPKCPDLDIEIDVKCEAVMTYQDLYYYNLERDKDYKNCRSAIIGLFSSNEGYLYQKYVTLIPLAVAATHKEDEFKFNDREEEIEFMNTFLSSYKEILRHSKISGNYKDLLFMINRFVDEADYVRPIMPVMYDGVVITYMDDHIKQILGRENSVNKYSVAVKFDTMKKLTQLVAITYTVGQNGVVTPMAHYNPVEFIGTIHTKSSISSVRRFNENQFKIGNIIQVEYRNDVMPYVSTPDIDANRDNPNPVLEFVTECPCCGEPLELSATMKSAKCINLGCSGRTVARMANMMDKLGINDFGEAMMEKLEVKKFHELIYLEDDYVTNRIGPTNCIKLSNALDNLITNPLYDYQIIGALGFTGISAETWKKIFNVYFLEEILTMYITDHLSELLKIKGIGKSIVDTISKEFYFFEEDIKIILNNNAYKHSKGLLDNQKSIRVTGFRDPVLMDELIKLGYDASDKGVTKSTSILLIPFEGYSSSKLNKVGENTLVIPKDEFINNMDHYLSLI